MARNHGTIWLGWSTCVALATLAPSPIARADAGGFRFSGPAQCPSESSVQQNAAAMVGRPVEALQALDVSAEVTELPDGRLQLAIRTPSGDRELIEASCAPLAEAASLIAALLLDPELVGAQPAESASAPSVRVALASPLAPPDELAADDQPPAPAPAAASPGVAALASPTARPASQVPAPAARTRVGVGLGGGFVVDLATLPSVTVGAMAELVLRIDTVDIRVRGTWLAEQSAGLTSSAPDAAPAEGAVRTLYGGGSLAACGRPFTEVGLAFCGGLHAGAIVARGDGISDPTQSEGVLFALSGGVALPWQPIPELDLELGAELVVPLATPVFVVAPFGDVFQPAPLSGRFTIAVHVDVS